MHMHASLVASSRAGCSVMWKRLRVSLFRSIIRLYVASGFGGIRRHSTKSNTINSCCVPFSCCVHVGGCCVAVDVKQRQPRSARGTPSCTGGSEWKWQDDARSLHARSGRNSLGENRVRASTTFVQLSSMYDRSSSSCVCVCVNLSGTCTSTIEQIVT